MDPLTHTLTGLALSRAGLSRACARPALLLMLASNAPDIDIAASAGGALSYLHYHRWITHSVLLVPVMALLPVLAICLFRRSWESFFGAFAVSVAGVLSHLLLDWCNPYGIRLLAPVSDHWYRLDLVNVVDPWVWLILAAAAVAPWLGRLVSAEIGARPGSGRGAALLALALLPSYGFGRSLLHNRAVAVLESRIYRGAPALRTAAFPAAANPFGWSGYVEGSGFVTLYRLNLLGDFDPDSGTTLFSPAPSPAIEAARRTETFRIFLDFNRYPLWSVVPGDGPVPTSEVSVEDARFGFRAVATVDVANQVRSERFNFGR